MVLKSDIAIAFQQQQLLLDGKPKGETRTQLAQVTLSAAFVLIITGIRRCGKSTLMQQLMHQLNSDVAFFNFEDPRIFGFETTDFVKLEEVIGENTLYYFFDEIQNIAHWELFIRNLHDKQNVICITGSNASLLSRELGTKLTGRNIQIELFPFSYQEYVSFKKIKAEAATFERYLVEGGFPEYLKTDNKELLQQLFKDIVYRDIIVRHSVRNDKVLISIALYLISNVGKEFSFTNIKNTFGVGSVNTVMDYISWFEDSYLLFTVPKFSWSLKSVAINPKKVYVIDTAFGDANSLSFSNDTGRLFENAVFLQLRRTYNQLYYFREKGECDFVVKEKNKVTNAIQVCTEVTQDNLPREVNGLLEALTFFDLKEGVIITMNQEDEMVQDEKKIHLIPAWKWFIT